MRVGMRAPHPQRLAGIGAGGGFRADDPGDEDGAVVGSAAEIGQVDKRLGRFGGRNAGEDRAQLGVFHAAGQAVAAEQIDIALLNGMRSFEIDLHRWIRAKRACDHVLGHDRGDVGPLGKLARRFQLPLQAVVEGELVNGVAAEPIDAAVADVGGERSLR